MPGPISAALMVCPFVVGAVMIALKGDIRLGDLTDVRIVGWGLMPLAAGIQIVRTTTPGWALPLLAALQGRLVVFLMWVCGALFVLLNVRGRSAAARYALVLAGTGFTMNAAAIVANGGMPFWTSGARWAGVPPELVADPEFGHVPITATTHLTVLSDVIPLPVVQMVVSLGDVLMLVGLAWFLPALVASDRDRRAPRPLALPCTSPQQERR